MSEVELVLFGVAIGVLGTILAAWFVLFLGWLKEEAWDRQYKRAFNRAFDKKLKELADERNVE